MKDSAGTDVRGPAAGTAIRAVIAVYVLLATAFSLVMPLGEAPDEVSHYSYVRYMALNGGLPPPEGAASGEAFQPPLYYAAGALVTFWVPEGSFTVKGNSDYSLAVVDSVPNVLLHTSQETFPYRDGALAWHLLRLLSVAMGAGTVWATYALGLLVFPGRPQLAVAAAAFNAFLPEFLFISSAVSNDNLVALLSGLTMLQMARLLTHDSEERAREHRRPAVAGWIWLGILLALGFWTKLSMLLFWPVALAAVAWTVWAGPGRMVDPWRAAAKRVLLVFVPAVIIPGPLALRNLSAYGDPMGWGLMRSVTEAVAGPLSPADYAEWFLQHFQSFWGRFGGAAHVLMPAPFYAGLAIVGVIALVGGVRVCGRWLGQLRRTRREALRPLDGVVMLLALAALMVAGLLWLWAHTNQGTGQARLAFPALAGVSLFFVAGLAEWRTGLNRRGLVGLPGLAAAGLLLVSVWVLFGFLLPLYHFPPRITLDQVPAAARRGPFLFGDEIRLVGWEMEARTLSAGDTGHVTLYWQVTGRPREDYWLLLRLQGAAEKPAWDKDGSPSAGRDSTDTWGPGDVIAARHRIALSEDAPAGQYRMLAGLHRFGEWEWLVIRDEGGKDLGDTLALESVQVTGR